MISEPDIWRSAKLLVDEHGADASIRAAQQADARLAAGDMQGHAVWLRILAAVKELMATKPPGSVHRRSRRAQSRPKIGKVVRSAARDLAPLRWGVSFVASHRAVYGRTFLP